MKQICNGNPQADHVLLFAHGAGAPMDSEFMDALANLIAGEDLLVVRFEFDYMALRREDGKKRPPDRQPKLLECFKSQLATLNENQHLKNIHIYIGGKSMGGRMASLLAAEAGIKDSLPEAGAARSVKGWLGFGYPFHPPGKPEKLRTEHFRDIQVPGLILQGSRDPFGNREEAIQNHCPDSITLNWLEDGNHDLVPRKSSGLTATQNWQQAAALARRFIIGQAEAV